MGLQVVCLSVLNSTDAVLVFDHLLHLETLHEDLMRWEVLEEHHLVLGVDGDHINRFSALLLGPCFHLFDFHLSSLDRVLPMALETQ